MTDRVTLREATDYDIPEILGVLAASLGETPLLQRTDQLFAWKHLHNPFGKSIVLVADVGQRIVGVRAFMRWELLTTDGHTVRCLRAVDTATHPEFQGRGIFRDLTLAAVESARADGVDMIFNTPNEKSAPGYLKMGWNEVGQVRPLVRPRIGRAVPPPTNSLLSLDELMPGAASFRPWAGSDRQPIGLRTPRHEHYQTWRFGSHPSASYGWIPGDGGNGAVVRASVRSGRTELLVPELRGGAGLVKQMGRAHKARYMAFAFSNDSPERKAARAAGAFQPPGVNGLRLVANDLSGLDIDVFDLASWDLSLGDLELL